MNTICIIDNFGEKIFIDLDYLKYSSMIRYLTKEFSGINPGIFNLSFSKIKMLVFLKVIRFLKHESEFRLKKLPCIHGDIKNQKRFKMWKHEFLKVKKNTLLKIVTISSFLGIKKLILFTTKIIGDKLEKTYPIINKSKKSNKDITVRLYLDKSYQ